MSKRSQRGDTELSAYIDTEKAKNFNPIYPIYTTIYTYKSTGALPTGNTFRQKRKQTRGGNFFEIESSWNLRNFLKKKEVKWSKESAKGAY